MKTARTSIMSSFSIKQPWRKILYERQPYPDNYVDTSFLEELKKNLHVRSYDIKTLMLEAANLSQQINSISLFVTMYFYMEDQTASPQTLWCVASVLTGLGYLINLLISQLRGETFSPGLCLQHARTCVLFQSLSVALSPILVSLTETISTDTIYAMTTLMLLANFLFYNYDYSEGSPPPPSITIYHPIIYFPQPPSTNLFSLPPSTTIHHPLQSCTTLNHHPPPSTVLHHPQPPSTTFYSPPPPSHPLQSSTALYSPLQPSTTIHHPLQSSFPPSPIFHHPLQSTTTINHHPPPYAVLHLLPTFYSPQSSTTFHHTIQSSTTLYSHPQLFQSSFTFHHKITQVPGPLSLNAAVFASVCLASRLHTAWHAFTTVTVSFQLFALGPLLRKNLKCAVSALRPRAWWGQCCIFSQQCSSWPCVRCGSTVYRSTRTTFTGLGMKLSSKIQADDDCDSLYSVFPSAVEKVPAGQILSAS
ncbi:phosphatidylinositol n-acetylglucosaminyltransferase subunit c-like [Plakobranchus ocellatus]|uniref:Phosphatidylinositol n-acetylglucosaminyltransferase subunit c-like n=1 Tax=Plakobranchus ocellatus TaxID=259542 RepID=A0AAV3XU40_9GAST|nr:phosphatidylinositol n-acetylglucosaminyltransferase subunit c-like [Plakobranchus ocellatus]